jgi:hypothetical protein
VRRLRLAQIETEERDRGSTDALAAAMEWVERAHTSHRGYSGAGVACELAEFGDREAADIFG